MPSENVDRVTAILKERARLLAKPIVSDSARRAERDCVLFRINPETYAIDCRYVRRIARSVGVTPIPGTPPFVNGVIRIREEIHSVFDLRALLGGQPQTIASDAKIIALGENRIEFCLLADEVAEVTAIGDSDIHSANSGHEHGKKSFIRGVTRDAVMVLDLAAMLRDQDLYIGGGVTHT